MAKKPNASIKYNAEERREIIQGILLLLALHVIFLLCCYYLITTPTTPSGNFNSLNFIILLLVALIGLVQFVYAIPALIIGKVWNRIGIVKGLILGAALTILLNGLTLAAWLGFGS